MIYEMSLYWKYLYFAHIKFATLRSSYTKAEEALMSSHIDISFSGTTSVIIIIISKKLFISEMKLICVNVGDSRAIMISSKKFSV